MLMILKNKSKKIFKLNYNKNLKKIIRINKNKKKNLNRKK